VIFMKDFDVIPSNFEAKLKEKCFQVVSLIAMVAEHPMNNAHYIAEIKNIVTDIEEDLEEVGLEGDGRSVPDTQQLDVVDLLFLKGAEGLKKYFQQKVSSGEEYDDDN